MIGKYLYQFVYVFYYKHDLWYKGSVFLAIRTLFNRKIFCLYTLYISIWHNYNLRKWLIIKCVAKMCLLYNVKVIMIRGL